METEKKSIDDIQSKLVNFHFMHGKIFLMNFSFKLYIAAYAKIHIDTEHKSIT